MKLAVLQLESFQGAPDGVYELARPDETQPVAVVTGLSGSGRSSLLGAMVAAKESIAPAGPPPDPSRLLRRGRSHGVLEATWLLDEEEIPIARTSGLSVTTRLELRDGRARCDAPAGLRKLFSRFDRDDSTTKLELVPEEITTTASRRIPEDAALKRQRPEARGDKYAWAPAALCSEMVGDAIAMRDRLRETGVVVEGDDADRAGSFRDAVRLMTPHVGVGPARDTGEGPEATFHVGSADGLSWNCLATSDRRAIALAIAIRYLGLSRSIILWDGIERWFDTRTRGRVLDALRTLAPRAQLVIAADDAASVAFARRITLS